MTFDFDTQEPGRLLRVALRHRRKSAFYTPRNDKASVLEISVGVWRVSMTLLT